MRTTLIAGLMTTLLLAAVTGAALAQPGGGSDQTDRQQRMKALHEARNASLASFKENRSAAFAEYHTAFNATKASFMENKTRVLAECAAARNATTGNATPGGDGNNTGGCVRDGMRPLIEQARAEHRAQKDALRERLLEARTNAMETFRQARAAMRGST